MKKCIHCGKELPQDAAWCPYCENPQNKPEIVRPPVRRRRKIISGFSVLALLLGVLLFNVISSHREKIYEGKEQITYQVNGQECIVFLSFTNKPKMPYGQAELVDAHPEGSSTATPSQLFAYAQNDPDIQEAFKNEIESCSVTAEPEGNVQAVDIYGPVPVTDSAFFGAWEADIVYSPETGTNRICWEIKMKNGDILHLSHKVTCNRKDVIEYHFEDTPMETVEEVSALLRKTAEESPDAILKLYLPPVTYQGSLVMDDRTAILFGSEQDGKKTTFTDTLEIKTRKPDIAELYDLEFQGNGGTGILASDALRLQACLFTGWDLGVYAQDGAWVSMNNVAFVGNDTGFCFDSEGSTYSNPIYENIVFAENATGMEIRQVPGNYTLKFSDPVFDGNETDYVDLTGLITIEQSSGSGN